MAAHGKVQDRNRVVNLLATPSPQYALQGRVEQIKKAAMAAHGKGESKKSDGAVKQEEKKESEGLEEELDEIDLKFKGEGHEVWGINESAA